MPSPRFDAAWHLRCGGRYLYLTTLIIYSVSLVKLGAKTPEELTDGEIFYDLDRYPKIGMTADREKRGSHNGYLTMVKNVRYFKNMCPTNIFRLMFVTHWAACYLHGVINSARGIPGCELSNRNLANFWKNWNEKTCHLRWVTYFTYRTFLVIECLGHHVQMPKMYFSINIKR